MYYKYKMTSSNTQTFILLSQFVLKWAAFKNHYPRVICMWKMELSSRDFRVMMFYDNMKDLHQEQSLENLKQLFGKNAEPRSFSAFVNLEAGGVSMMRTSAAYQRLLLRLQTSRQQKNLSGQNQGLPLERFRKVLASERQRPCPYCTIIFVSENDVQVDSPLIDRQTMTA